MSTYTYITFSQSMGFTATSFDTREDAIAAGVEDARDSLVSTKTSDEVRAIYEKGEVLFDSDTYSAVVKS